MTHASRCQGAGGLFYEPIAGQETASASARTILILGAPCPPRTHSISTIRQSLPLLGTRHPSVPVEIAYMR